MLDQLKTLQPFFSLEQSALATVARHASWLRLPANRALKRRSQPFGREMFLIEGTVAARRGDGIERLHATALGGQSLNRHTNDASEISTVTSVALIVVDLDPIRFLLDDDQACGPAVGGVDGWMHALLQGPIMHWFSPSSWARVLRTGKPRKVRRGERIIARGELCTHVFVVTDGLAKGADVQYPPGAFFGEQSALGQCAAVEDVVMETEGTIVCFERADVVAMAADYDPPRMDPPPRRLDLDQIPAAQEQVALAALTPLPPVAVRASDPARRLRVAAELMRRGVTVV